MQLQITSAFLIDSADTTALRNNTRIKVLNDSCDARSKVAVVKRSAYNSVKFTISSRECILLRTFHRSGSNAEEEEWKPIVNPRFNAISPLFFFSLSSSGSHFVSYVSSAETPSFTLIVSGSLNETGPRAGASTRNDCFHIRSSHDICIPHAVTNTDVRSRVNMRRASVSIPTCELCS